MSFCKAELTITKFPSRYAVLRKVIETFVTNLDYHAMMEAVYLCDMMQVKLYFIKVRYL